MDINVTINLPGIPEALNALADAIRSNKCECGHSATAAAPTQDKPSAEKRTRRSSKSEATVLKIDTPVTVTEEPAKTETPAKAEESKKTYTLDQISYAGVDLMERGHMDELFALLAKYGIQSLTAADPSMYSAIAEDLIAMGATIGG